MILHLLTDEKFTDYAIKHFLPLEMHSEFVLIPSNNMMNHVKLIDKCSIIPQDSKEFEKLLNRLNQYTGIIFHGMFWSKWQTPILRRVSDNMKIAWVFWGGEIYSRYELYSNFLAPITKAFHYVRYFFKNKKIDVLNEMKKDDFRRVDYCLTDEREEFSFACQYLNKSFDYLWYNYYSLEETVGSLENMQCTGENIWIGNSSAIKNNHFDILLHLLQKGLFRKLKKKKIILPLSYGDIWIRNLFVKYGNKLCGKCLQMIVSFMPRNEYNELMLSCSTMIIGYRQPAAQGNIITGLWLGMRVYLSEKSIAYNYFTRIGCKIYSIERDLNYKNRNVFAPMKQEDIDTNRLVLRKWYSKEEMYKRNLEIVKALS